MLNNSITSTGHLDLTSISGSSQNSLIRENQLIRVEQEDMSVLEAGHILSIELNRQKIRNELEGLFLFKTKNKEIDFLAENQNLRMLLPSIGIFFKNHIGGELSLILELMEEDLNWRTLFINISINSNFEWQTTNKIIDDFFDNMFDMFPNVAEKLNIDFVPDGI
jgi:hypothetical protein